MSGAAVAVTDATFAAEVKQSKGLTLVDFWAPWCPPCRAVGPTVEKLAGEFNGQIKVVKLNTEDNPQTPREFGISAIPTFIVFKDGQPAFGWSGAMPEAKFRDLMTKIVQFQADPAKIREALNTGGALGVA